MKAFKSLLMVVSLCLGIVGSGTFPAYAQAMRDGVVIHISSGPENPHKVLMALNMAKIMSETKDVLVYFDIEGVKVVLQDAEDLAYAQFPSSKEALQALSSQGVSVYACPGCLKAAGKTPADLMSGILVADKDAFFSFTEGRILTLDY